MADNKEIDLLVKLKTDLASLRELKSSLTSLKEDLTASGKSGETSYTEFAKKLSNVNREIDNIGRSIRRLGDSSEVGQVSFAKLLNRISLAKKELSTLKSSMEVPLSKAKKEIDRVKSDYSAWIAGSIIDQTREDKEREEATASSLKKQQSKKERYLKDFDKAIVENNKIIKAEEEKAWKDRETSNKVQIQSELSQWDSYLKGKTESKKKQSEEEKKLDRLGISEFKTANRQVDIEKAAKQKEEQFAANYIRSEATKITDLIQKRDAAQKVLTKLKGGLIDGAVTSALTKSGVDFDKALSAIRVGLEREVKLMDRALTGYKSGFARFSGGMLQSVTDLVKWQAKWYGAKAILFTPLELMGKGTKDAISWQQAMKNAGAVSEYTKDELSNLGEVTKKIGLETSVSATEAAGALLEFAQAGIKYNDAMQALPLAAKMVIPTNESMKDSVSALVTVINAWHLTSKDVPRVANEIGSAMAESKLKIADLSTVFNHLAATASAFNMSTKDSLVLVTALSQAGVKSSTIATGLRQTLRRLTENMPFSTKQMLDKAGAGEKWTWRDFVIPQNDVLVVFERLQKLFSSGKLKIGDVFSGFETRGGANLIAVLNLALGKIEELRKKIGTSDWISTAVAKSMEGLENQFKRFVNIITTPLKNMGIIDFISSMLKSINDLISGVTKLNPVLAGMFTSLGVLLGAQLLGSLSILKKTGEMFIWLKLIGEQLILALNGVALVSSTTLKAALLSPIGWIALLAVSIGGIIALWKDYKNNLQEIEDQHKSFVGSISTMSPWAAKYAKSEAERRKSELEEEERDINLQKFNKSSSLYSSGGFATRLSEIEKQKRKEQQIIDEADKQLKAKEQQKARDTTIGNKDDKKLRGKSEFVDLRKGIEERIKILTDEQKTITELWDSAHKLGQESEISYRKALLSIDSSYIDKKIELEKELLNSLTSGKLYESYKADLGKLGGKEGEAEAKAELTRRHENAKLETERKIKDLEATKFSLVMKGETEIALSERKIRDETIQQDIKRTTEGLQARLAVEKLFRERATTLMEWMYDKNLISSKKYFENEKNNIDKDLEARIESLNRQEIEAIEKNNAIAERSGENSDELRTSSRNLISELLKIEDERYQAYVEYGNKRLTLELKIKDSIKNAYEQGLGVGLAKTLENIQRQYQDMATLIDSSVSSLASSMENAFMSFFDYTSAEFMNWKNLVLNILQEVYKELVKTFIVKQAVGVIAGGISSWLGNGSGSGYVDAGDFAGWGGNRASGGRISLNSAYIVGERGPELFVPDSNGTIVPNNAINAGGLSPNVEVNVINNTGIPFSAKSSPWKMNEKTMVKTIMLDLINTDPSFANTVQGRR